MRDLKFRFWDREDSTMNECIRIELPNNTNPDPDNPHGVNVMQYTGLKDKNGKEIYEGDIVVHHLLRGEKYMVFFNELKARFSLKDKDTCWGVDSSEALRYCEVIGNIYENPELLE